MISKIVAHSRPTPSMHGETVRAEALGGGPLAGEASHRSVQDRNELPVVTNGLATGLQSKDLRGHLSQSLRLVSHRYHDMMRATSIPLFDRGASGMHKTKNHPKIPTVASGAGLTPRRDSETVEFEDSY